MNSEEILIYENYDDTETIVNIPFESIMNVNLCDSDPNVSEDCPKNKECLFTLTTEKEKYYCGFKQSAIKNPMTTLAESFYETFQISYLPHKRVDNQEKVCLLLINAFVVFSIFIEMCVLKSMSEAYEIKMQELLGSGHFGSVFGGVERLTGKQVAIKIITKNVFGEGEHALDDMKSQFKNESRLLSSINHPGVLKLLAMFDEENHVNYLEFKLSRFDS